jgi:type I restriction enzyme S subunit
MTDWRDLTLDQLGRIVTGKTPPTADTENYGGAIPFVTPSDMDGRRSISHTTRYLTERGLRTVANAKIPSGSVMVSCIGSDMGKAAIAQSECVTNQQINSIIVAPEFDASFVYYNLSIRKEEIRNAASGSAQPIMNKSTFGRLRIAVPDKTRQTSLASVLSALDDKIELNRRMNETLEAMARAIFKDWFVDFGPTRAKMEGRAPYLAADIWSLFPDALDESGKPVGWSIETLKSLASRSGGQIRTGPFGSQLHQSDYLDAGIPVVMPANLTSGEIIEDGIARIGTDMAQQMSAHAMTDGDIVYGRRGDIGRKALVGPDEAGWICGTGCLRISVRADECPPIYLFYHLDRPDVREWISARAIGATMPNLNTGILGEVEILLPGIDLTKYVTQTIEPMFRKMRSNRRENQTLAATRDLLLPKLMSGEIRIKDAEKIAGEAA